MQLNQGVCSLPKRGSQGNVYRLKNIKEKPGNSTNSGDNHGDTGEIVCLCSFYKSIS